MIAIRDGELTPKTHPQLGLQTATRLHEAEITSRDTFSIDIKNVLSIK